MLEGAWSIPEVEAVGASTSVPLTVGAWSAQFFLPGVPPMEGQDGHWVLFTSVDPSFFEVMGISLVAGRGIAKPDQAGAEAVVVVNQAAVRRFWPEEDPLGKEIVALHSGLRYRVVGVVRDTKAESMDGSTRPLFHFAYAQFPTATVKLVARGPAAPGKVAASLRGAVRAVHPDLVILAETTLADQRSVLLLPARLAAGLLSLFGGLAAVLASLGLYGAVSSVVSCRTREVVIRISLGADTRDVVGTVVGGVMRTVLAGAAVGLAATFGLSRLLDRFLIGVGPHDLITLTAVPLLLGVIALLAAFLPARRAARADPAGVLRYQ
jgi:putative ABC transport system permease protein